MNSRRRLLLRSGPPRPCDLPDGTPNAAKTFRTQLQASDMIMKSTHDSPILVTGAAGAIGAIGRNLTAMLLAKGHMVRALVRREDERADALRRLGAEVMLMESFNQGLLTLDRLRNGRRQVVTVQHVTVGPGGHAIVAGEVSPGGSRRRGGNRK